MKTVFNAAPSNDCRSNFPINIFLNKQYRIVLFMLCSCMGMTAAIQASPISGKENRVLLNDTLPTVSLVADYCIVAGKIRITAQSTPIGATYTWSTGEVGSVIDVDIANMYHVVAHFSNGVTAAASIKIAQELVVNGDFSGGNTGFFSEYAYSPDVAGNSELNPEGRYGIGTNGQNYHGSFFGKEHTTQAQTGNFMIVNGSTTTIGSPARQRVIWQQTVNVLPNVNYYFSAYAMNVHPSSPARLQFEVNGVLIGTIADLNIAPKPNSNGTVNRSNWIRFYSNPTWTSGNNTTAVIRIINLNADASGNDFGLDDISFSTLSPFITLVSPSGTDAQETCINLPITPIVYSVGSDASGHSITNLPPGITASFEVPNFLTISGAPTTSENYTYSITTTGTCNPVTVTGSINMASTSTTWSGLVSNDWSDPNNWFCGYVPTAATNVKITTLATRMPLLTAPSVCKQLYLQTGTALNLNGQCFTNYGGITGTGVFKGSASSGIIIDAPGETSMVRFDQSIPGASNALNNLTIRGINNSVQLNTRLELYGVLAPQSGKLTINDTLTLRSTCTGTASVDKVTGAIAYGSLGKVEVERYFPARRAWRLVTSPLTGAGSIFNTWQNGGKYVPGKGTYVSGPGAVNPTGTNGLDWSPQNNSSLKTSSTLTPVLNTRVSLSKNIADSSDNLAYFLFVRGDRDPANTNPALSNNTTLSSFGKLQTGRQTFKAASNMGGFTLVGNPYAAPVDFNKIVLNNVKKHFWVWDPYLNTEQGGYILVEEIGGGNYTTIPPSPGGMNQVLESSQAFFVETESNNPASIVFQEASKSNTAASLTAFRPLNTIQFLRTNLYHLNQNNNTHLLDGTMVLFDESFSNSVDSRDVIKLSNAKEMLSLERDTKKLTLERRALPGINDTLFLRLTKTTQRWYRFEFEPAGMDPMLTAFLEDSYSGVKTPLSLTGKSTFDFELNGNTASAAANRFRIIFKQTTGVLPVTYKTVTASQQAEDIIVKWSVENELNTKEYEVEKSSNGINFQKVNTTVATGINSSSTNYQWLDVTALSGNNYYRIKNIDADGKYEYSKIVLVKISNSDASIGVSPNPTPGDNIGISFTNMEAGMYHTKLLNSLGQTMFATLINHTAGTSLKNIVPGKKLAAGIYQLVVSKPDHTMSTIKVIVQ